MHEWKQIFLSRIFIFYVIAHSNRTVSLKSHLWDWCKGVRWNQLKTLNKVCASGTDEKKQTKKQYQKTLKTKK